MVPSPLQHASWHSGRVAQTFAFYCLGSANPNCVSANAVGGCNNLELSAEERKKHVLAGLELVGLGDRISHYPRHSREARNSAWLSLGLSSAIPPWW
jgi:predicted ABC-type transport system involved in lysophospholipase L1 biosynthesis ATPase subunit